MNPSVGAAIVGYLLGSLPLGWLFVRLGAGVDLRTSGSGNVGATNAARLVDWRTGAVVAAVDIAKGVAAVSVASLWWSSPAARAAAAVAVVVGHVFPIWLRFKGGKGVAPAAGALGLLLPGPTALAAGVFLVVGVLTRIASAASLSGVVALLVASTWVDDEWRLAVLSIGCLIVWRHRDNVWRLWRGEERKVRG